MSDIKRKPSWTRRRFLGRTLLAGTQVAAMGWDTLARGVEAVILLLTLLGIAVVLPVLLPGHSLWLVSVVIGAVVLAVLGEGSFRVWRQDGSAAGTSAELAEQKGNAGRDAAKAIAATRLQELNDQLQAATQRATDLEASPISADHQRDLQIVASMLAKGVGFFSRAVYRESEKTSVHVAYAFAEHFTDLASEIDLWNRSIDDLAERRKRLDESVADRLRELGDRYHYGSPGGLERLVAASAESMALGEPLGDMALRHVAGYVQVGPHVLGRVGSLYEGRIQEGITTIRNETAAGEPCGSVVECLGELEDMRPLLVQQLSLIAERDNIPRGKGCRLC